VVAEDAGDVSITQATIQHGEGMKKIGVLFGMEEHLSGSPGREDQLDGVGGDSRGVCAY